MAQDGNSLDRRKIERPLTIVHCVRSTVGGIFRHICDVVKHQSEKGYRVGLICDSLTGGAFEEARLAELAPYLALGVLQVPMHRRPSFSDYFVMRKMMAFLADIDVDVIHGHGAKGGAYGRIVGKLLSVSRIRQGHRKVVTVYSPHGGSLHYDENSLKGAIYFRMERFLEHLTDAFIFVSGFERDAYSKKVGHPFKPFTIAYNGLRLGEFEPVQRAENAVDFLYAGHMRDLKGTDLFIDAIEKVNARSKRPVRALMFGDGQDRPRYEAEVKRRNLGHLIDFRDPDKIRDIFARGHILVIPSRAESMPYIVLEALGAKQPVIATKVGGIPEIYGSFAEALIRPGDAAVIADAMMDAMENPNELQDLTDRLHRQVADKFTVHHMCQLIDDIYESQVPEQARLRCYEVASNNMESRVSTLSKAQ